MLAKRERMRSETATHLINERCRIHICKMKTARRTCKKTLIEQSTIAFERAVTSAGCYVHGECEAERIGEAMLTLGPVRGVVEGDKIRSKMHCEGA